MCNLFENSYNFYSFILLLHKNAIITFIHSFLYVLLQKPTERMIILTKKKKLLYGILLFILLAATVLFGIIGIIAVTLLCALIAAGLYIIPRSFLKKEVKVRTAWSVDVGELIGSNNAQQIHIHKAQLHSSLSILQLVPFDIQEEGFTYYDTAVQNRIAAALETAKANCPQKSWTAEAPLAILSPFGTGGNDLYLYFETVLPTRIEYTIHVEDVKIPDYTAIAVNGIQANEYSKTHEFLMIGLVPGYTNHVTMTIVGSWGTIRQIVTFEITMPDTHSHYPVILEYENGNSITPMTNGLFSMMRVNGYLGYGFFFDNNGVMRYEMILEGFGTDRFLYQSGSIITCVSVNKLAKFNSLGRIEQTYSLDGYNLHHDICLSGPNTVMALVTKLANKTVEDVIVEVNLSTGEVTELLDFAKVMEDYVQNFTRPIQPTDDMFFWAGKWDWLHLNTLQYNEKEDCIIISSRETSTIIKVTHIHTQPEIDWFLGNPAFWADTPYSQYSLTAAGEFVYQYGQHTAEYHNTSDTDGIYYLRTYNNNYWSLNSRDFEMPIENSVSRSLTGKQNDLSWIYIYEINENNRTFRLHEAFSVPYSSIVSNAEPFGSQQNWIINCGIAKLFGEYDKQGQLIRQFHYTCDLQNYRTFKFQTDGFWFQQFN